MGWLNGHLRFGLPGFNQPVNLLPVGVELPDAGVEKSEFPVEQRGNGRGRIERSRLACRAEIA